MTQRALIWAAVSSAPQATPEHYSLSQQEVDARAVCERNEWEIVDTLVVDGHSRDYIDIHKLASDASAKGKNAFTRLLAHFERKDFDVLVCLDGNRFARTQPLHAYIVVSIVKECGARIYLLDGGWIDDHNFMMYTAMDGFKSAQQISRLVEARKRGVARLTERGIPSSAFVVMSHKRIRDERGKALPLVLDETKARLWMDLATLLLEGVGWRRIERELYDRFGHAADNGQPYTPNRLYHTFHNPAFWGHTATGQKRFDFRRAEWWRIEPGHPTPDGVVIAYNTHEPVYKGDLADKIKAELFRRADLHGRAKPAHTYMFTGLFICATCGYKLLYYTEPRRGNSRESRKLYCVSRWANDINRPTCSETIRLSEIAAQEYLDGILRQMLTAETIDIFDDSLESRDSVVKRTEQLKAEIADLEVQSLRMIVEQSRAGEAVQNLYRQSIQAANDRLFILRQNLDMSVEQVAQTRSHDARTKRLYRELEALSVDGFWQQDGRTINQMLRQIMGNKCFAVKGGKVIGVVESPTRKKP